MRVFLLIIIRMIRIIHNCIGKARFLFPRRMFIYIGYRHYRGMAQERKDVKLRGRIQDVYGTEQTDQEPNRIIHTSSIPKDKS